MKKIKLLKQSLVLFTCLALSSTVLMAQSAAKKPGIKNDPVHLKMVKEEQAKKQAGEKAKQEAAQTVVNAQKKSAARPCVTKVSQGPSPVKRSTFNALSPKGQELIKSQPEKYVIVD